MIILKAIGTFFVRIWRWIKETAWVQPLLIVGAIFAVIFSIPFISSWVGSFGWGTSTAYYAGFQKSLEGEKKGETDRSDADKLTNSVYVSSAFNSTVVPDTAAYGEKFFLVYVSSDCTSCESIQPGFEYLQDNWKGNYTPADGLDFKMYTIFTDEESSTDDDYTLEGQTAFQRYLNSFSDFFNEAGGRLNEAPYKGNKDIADTDYDYFSLPDLKNFSTPTILLVDYSAEAIAAGRQGVSDVLFGLTGTTKADKAQLLVEMWNHFAPKSAANDPSTNPFSDLYIKG